MNKKKYTLPVTWSMCGNIEVEADSLQAAIDKLKGDPDSFSLPSDSSYVDSSFEMTAMDIADISEIYNNGNM